MKAKENYYAVRRGRVPGLYRSWDEAKEQVAGFASAEYKKFASKQEAEQYLTGKEEPKTIGSPTDGLHIFIDGSYDIKTQRFSYGLVGFYHGTRFEEARAFVDPDVAKHRNIAGELYGSYRALQIAIEKEEPVLDIYYDYAGIKEWAVGGWRAKNPLTRAYAQTYHRFQKDVTVRFHKIAAHTGHPLNERADALAKQALQEEE